MDSKQSIFGLKKCRRVIAAAALAGLISSGSGSFVALSQQQAPQREENREQWYRDGQKEVEAARRLKQNRGKAKNIILFIGDGMGVSTVTAARILEGQLRGQKGEENLLSFERLPHLGLSKTYSANQQTSDSAPTMTAMVTGVKTEDGILAVDQDVVRSNHTTVAGNELKTILEIAEEQGKSTGLVSTARITHATPAANYAHSASRDWESDAELNAAARAAGFPDIARQLIEFPDNIHPGGNGIEVALGGGRSYFLPNTFDDPEDAGAKGRRLDGRNLPVEWVGSGPNSSYVWNKAQFDAINPANTDRLLGLFERSHMEFEHDRAQDTGGEPTLTEMTVKAIDILEKNPNGFYLHVESGRIDHAHHAGNAFRALTETIEFSNTIRAAIEKVDLRETLIVVSADHSHVFTIGGYPTRGNPILGLVKDNDAQGNPDPNFSLDLLGKPYTTLGYANGPGYTGASNQQPEGSKTHPHAPSSATGITSGRPTLTEEVVTDPNYLQEAIVPFGSETHSGEDVAIYAGGPGAYLFHGVHEQNVIFHVMIEALKLSNQNFNKQTAK